MHNSIFFRTVMYIWEYLNKNFHVCSAADIEYAKELFDLFRTARSIVRQSLLSEITIKYPSELLSCAAN